MIRILTYLAILCNLWLAFDLQNWYAAGLSFVVLVLFSQMTDLEDKLNRAINTLLNVRDALTPLDKNDPQ